MTTLRQRVAAILAVAILSAFTGLIALELTKPKPRPCGCGGALVAQPNADAARHSLQWGLARNASLMVAAAVLFYCPGKSPAGVRP